MLIANINVPAFIKKFLLFSYNWTNKFLSDGNLYSGSSINKGSSSFLNIKCLNIIPKINAKIIPKKYNEATTSPTYLGKNTDANIL